MYHVWIVITSIDYEGGAVKGVFTTQKEAEKHLMYLKSEKTRCNFDDVCIERVATDHPISIDV
jgi:hypothetical protein